MMTVTTGWMRLIMPEEVVMTEDKNLLLAFENWFHHVAERKPVCLLCDLVWTENQQATKTVGAFFIVVYESMEHAIMAGVCRDCVTDDVQDTQSRCYKEYMRMMPDAVPITAPHKTTQ